jgi:hypothetical protein
LGKLGEDEVHFVVEEFAGACVDAREPMRGWARLEPLPYRKRM